MNPLISLFVFMFRRSLKSPKTQASSARNGRMELAQNNKRKKREQNNKDKPLLHPLLRGYSLLIHTFNM